MTDISTLEYSTFFTCTDLSKNKGDTPSIVNNRLACMLFNGHDVKNEVCYDQIET